MEERAKLSMLRNRRRKKIEEVFEEVGAVIDTHVFNEFLETKSSSFPKKAIKNKNAIEMTLLKKTRRTIHCSPKTMKGVREIMENPRVEKE